MTATPWVLVPSKAETLAAYLTANSAAVHLVNLLENLITYHNHALQSTLIRLSMCRKKPKPKAPLRVGLPRTHLPWASGNNSGSR